jgi:hypothetical protein
LKCYHPFRGEGVLLPKGATSWPKKLLPSNFAK